jgi:hypothetical protein
MKWDKQFNVVYREMRQLPLKLLAAPQSLKELHDWAEESAARRGHSIKEHAGIPVIESQPDEWQYEREFKDEREVLLAVRFELEQSGEVFFFQVGADDEIFLKFAKERLSAEDEELAREVVENA